MVVDLVFQMRTEGIKFLLASLIKAGLLLCLVKEVYLLYNSVSASERLANTLLVKGWLDAYYH